MEPEYRKRQIVRVRASDVDAVGIIDRTSEDGLLPYRVAFADTQPDDWSSFYEWEIERFVPDWKPGDAVRVKPAFHEHVRRVKHFATVGDVGVVVDDPSFDGVTCVEFGAGAQILGSTLEDGQRRTQYVCNAELELVTADEDLDDEDDDGPAIVDLSVPMRDVIAELTSRSILADLGAGADDRNPPEWTAHIGAAFGDIATGAAAWTDNVACGDWHLNDGVLTNLREDAILLAADALEFVTAIDEQQSQA